MPCPSPVASCKIRNVACITYTAVSTFVSQVRECVHTSQTQGCCDGDSISSFRFQFEICEVHGEQTERAGLESGI